MLLVMVLVGLVLAYANGANDNFKGVATLLGSGTTSYRRALSFATVTTALGSLTALVVARELLVAFSGKGIVPAEVLQNPSFPVAVALATAATVLLATRFGFPISTTHALIGALLGAGCMASSVGIDEGRLMHSFLLPLLTSPLIAVVLAGLVSKVGAGAGHIGNDVVTAGADGTQTVLPAAARSGSLIDGAHYLSAGAVSFARGVNDTPKIAALLLIGGTMSPGMAVLGVGTSIALGGIISARRVAHTMAHEVTEMTPSQGLSANIVTSVLVIGASTLGMPVSTTHVSCGSLFGIGAASRGARYQTIKRIVLAWVVTLPLAATLAALILIVLQA
jgi:PiT family inorganic phosphate transporter